MMQYHASKALLVMQYHASKALLVIQCFQGSAGDPIVACVGIAQHTLMVKGQAQKEPSSIMGEPPIPRPVQEQKQVGKHLHPPARKRVVHHSATARLG